MNLGRKRFTQSGVVYCEMSVRDGLLKVLRTESWGRGGGEDVGYWGVGGAVVGFEG